MESGRRRIGLSASGDENLPIGWHGDEADDMLKMGYRHQRTLARPAVISGPGLVTGAPVQVKLHPAPENTGVVFVRSDRPDYPVIPARAEWVTSTQRRTTLGGGESARNRRASMALRPVSSTRYSNRDTLCYRPVVRCGRCKNPSWFSKAEPRSPCTRLPKGPRTSSSPLTSSITVPIRSFPSNRTR